ncbi:MAG: hypothetical protein FWH55_10790 [Oscillospiraceae bacterium]|nr:hypothetical protein [Oscillospiraceae bacterium]
MLKIFKWTAIVFFSIVLILGLLFYRWIIAPPQDDWRGRRDIMPYIPDAVELYKQNIDTFETAAEMFSENEAFKSKGFTGEQLTDFMPFLTPEEISVYKKLFEVSYNDINVVNAGYDFGWRFYLGSQNRTLLCLYYNFDQQEFERNNEISQWKTHYFEEIAPNWHIIVFVMPERRG